MYATDSKANGFPKELLPPTIQLFGDQNELLPPMINYRIFGCIELLAIKMNLNLCRHEVWGYQNELLQPMIEFLVEGFQAQGLNCWPVSLLAI